MLNSENTGILLVGHGTRHLQGQGAFRRFADAVAAAATPRPVEIAFLELQEPMINQGLRALCRRGCSEIVVAPVLLFSAGHAEEDIPSAVQSTLAALVTQGAAAGNVHCFQAQHLGCHERLIALSARRLVQALARSKSAPAGKTCLLLVGRGSRSESATAEMHEYARLVRHHLSDEGILIDDTGVAFLAMAEPSLSTALAQLADGSALQRIVVQPHLLFPGELLEQLELLVKQAAIQAPEIEWLVAPILSGHQGAEADNPLLIAALLDRINQARPNSLSDKPHLLFPLSPRD